MNSPPVRSVLILGARSDIARPLARIYAEDGYDVILAARNADDLAGEAADIRIRSGRDAKTREFNALDVNAHGQFIDDLEVLPDTVISLIGLMTDQHEAQSNFSAADLMIRSNYLCLVSILGKFAEQMEQRGSGTIIGISSVAGDRGRATNYIYGSAKAGFTTFLSGLRTRMISKGISVITIKPGYVNTRMTEGMRLPRRLTADPRDLALAIRAAHRKGRMVVYYRPIWRLIMLIIRGLPERIFMRTRF